MIGCSSMFSGEYLATVFQFVILACVISAFAGFITWSQTGLIVLGSLTFIALNGFILGRRLKRQWDIEDQINKNYNEDSINPINNKIEPEFFDSDLDTEEHLKDMTEEIYNIYLKEEKDGEATGSVIADDCVKNGLLAGDIVKYSDIQTIIRKNHNFNPDAIISGFLLRMSEYTKTNMIISISTESDLIFIHKDHVDKYV